MLNFCQTILRFGHLRRVWDGNRERYVNFLKPFLGNIRSTDTYFGLKHDQIHRKKGLNGIIESFLSLFPELQSLSEPVEQTKQYNRDRVYGKLASIGYGLEGVPLSAIQVHCTMQVNEEGEFNGILGPADEPEEMCYFVVYRQGRNKKLLTESVIDHDAPEYIHRYKLLQAYPVRMMLHDITAVMDFIAHNLVQSIILLPYQPLVELEVNHYWV
jgi:hypothetical protein